MTTPIHQSLTESLPTEHIKALNQIAEVSKPYLVRLRLFDNLQDIPKLLLASSSAVAALTEKPIDPSSIPADESSVDPSDPLAARKRAFLAHNRQFYTLLRSVRDGLRREADALAAAGLLDSTPTTEELGPGLTNGGLGNFDVGWLNSRTRDVGVGKERELVKQLRELLEQIKNEKKEMRENDGEEMNEDAG
jgi:Mediator complex protein